MAVESQDVIEIITGYAVLCRNSPGQTPWFALGTDSQPAVFFQRKHAIDFRDGLLSRGIHAEKVVKVRMLVTNVVTKPRHGP